LRSDPSMAIPLLAVGMKRLLVFGLSGQIGSALAPLLGADGYDVTAVSRQPRDDTPVVRWQRASLETAPPSSDHYDAIVSLGPLDAFSDWITVRRPNTSRVIAIGSTSASSKVDASDPGERQLAANLQRAETRLRDACAAAGIALTLLRPTLIYGNGRDQTLTPMLALARRWHLLPWPRAATGLRQPVHVDDLATAVLRCLERPQTAGRSFDLPGGEILSVAAMLERSARALAPEVRLLPVPLWAFGLAMTIAARASGRAGSTRGIAQRLTCDQVFDAEPARVAFGYVPRPFTP
jgi:nucleoside-diphosphate-sugar epimerase